MKIYFAAAIRGGREDRQLYQKLISFLKMNKHQKVLTEHIGSSQLISTRESKLSDKEIRDRDIDLLTQADLVIAETSQPSLGVGYELAQAEQQAKPVIILHRPGKSTLSAMINGTDYFKDKVHQYETLEDAKRVLNSELELVAKQIKNASEEK